MIITQAGPVAELGTVVIGNRRMNARRLPHKGVQVDIRHLTFRKRWSERITNPAVLASWQDGSIEEQEKNR